MIKASSGSLTEQLFDTFLHQCLSGGGIIGVGYGLTDIQDEKPQPVWVPRNYYSDVKIKDDDVQMFISEDMNAWLEKLEDTISREWQIEENKLRRIIVERGRKLEAVRKAFIKYFEEDLIGFEDFQASDYDECDSYYFTNTVQKILEDKN